MKVIVIEDNILFCDYICSLLQKADFKTMKAHGLAQAKKMIRGSIHEDDMVLADLRLPDGESTALLKWMRDNGYMHPFIMMTNYEEIHSAVHAMKLGAEDFILKPLVEDKLLPAIRKIKAANDTFSKVIYERRSASFCELNQYIHLVAPTDMTVLILGNTGTGKEHLANKIHRRSLRANKPYIKVDCVCPKIWPLPPFSAMSREPSQGLPRKRRGISWKRREAPCSWTKWRISQ